VSNVSSVADLVNRYGRVIADKSLKAARAKAFKLWLDDGLTMSDDAATRYAVAVARNLATEQNRNRPIVKI
jgi:hypothetical protein